MSLTGEKPTRKIEDILNDENIVGFEDFHRDVEFVFGKIANSVGKTLGPGGGYTIISNIDASVPVYPTKDGYTVVQEYKFNDQTKYFIAEIIKDIPRRMNLEVGDGTTSGLLIAFELYKELIRYKLTTAHPEIGCEIPPISIRLILEETRKVLLEALLANKEYILKNSDIDRETEDKLITKVATISANNDPEIGNIVADLFIKRGSNHVYITNDVGSIDETIIDKEVGFQFGAGFTNPIMANQTDRITCKFDNPRFLLIDGPVTENDIPNLNKMIDYVIYDLKNPLVIVAKDYDQAVTLMLTARCTRNVINQGNTPVLHPKEDIACLLINSEHEKSRDRLEDLRIILGCEIVTTKKGKIMDFKDNVDYLNSFLGAALEFKGTQLSTRIRRGKGEQSAIVERIKHVEERIKEISANDGMLAFSGIADLKRRIAMLNSDMTIIKVGGSNDKERRAKKLIYDDAIAACQSAVDNGFTLGGNVSIPHYIRTHGVDLVNQITSNLVNGNRHIIVGNNYDHVRLVVEDIVIFIDTAFKAAYNVAIENMVGKGTDACRTIFKTVYDSMENGPVVFDLVTGKPSTLLCDNPSPIVPGNTDTELMSSIFGAVGTLVSSNQFLSIYPGASTIYRVQK